MTENRQRSLDVSTEMTVRAVVDELAATLDLAGIDEPRTTSRDILGAILEVPRHWTVMNRDHVLDADLAITARLAAHRLTEGAPFAYAVGRAQFRHLHLLVDDRVLIPRPETEILVEEILARFRSLHRGATDWGMAADIGTGSGAIALSLAVEGRFRRVVATDASLDALDVASTNAARVALSCPVEFRAGSLLRPVRDLELSLLVSNPPYVAYSEAEALPASVRDWEPPTALFSGSNGLAATAAIVQEGAALLGRGGVLALEVDERRASLVAELVMSAGSYIDVGVGLDLTGRERFVFASRG